MIPGMEVQRPWRAEPRDPKRPHGAWWVVDGAGWPFAFCLTEEDAKTIAAAGAKPAEQGQAANL